MIQGGYYSANLEYALIGNNGLVFVSFFDRSLSGVKSVAASINEADNVRISGRSVEIMGQYDCYVAPVVYGKEKFYHCYAVTKSLNKSLILTTEENKQSDFFSFLMEKYNYPLMKEWAEVLFDKAYQAGFIIRNIHRNYIKGVNCVEEPAYRDGNKTRYVKDLRVYDVSMQEDDLKNLVSESLKDGSIRISNLPQKHLDFANMDEYFEKYGSRLVENLERHIKPLAPLSGNCDTLVLNKMKLFPQQAANVNGIINLLRHSSYGILNMGCGTGKTICGTSIVEGYFNERYLRTHKGATLKDVYSKPDNINYRNIVMAPGHLVEKWASEIRREVPYAKVTILSEFSQLNEIYRNGRDRNGKEWFILGKDFAKLSYQSIPIPTKVGTKHISQRQCKECKGKSDDFRGLKFKCSCGCEEYDIVQGYGYETGMLCPECKSILFPNGFLKRRGKDDDSRPLNPEDFANSNARNQRCGVCGAELWQPYIRNINTPNTPFFEHANRHSKWKRVTHYKNMAHKMKVTAWVHEDYEDSYFEKVRQVKLSEVSPESKGVRRVAPAQFIKTHLKGFFDFAIIDEAHTCKGGDTAQGNAMAALLSASKKKLALTGTLAGGKASDLFYLLFRLDSKRMGQHGFSYYSLQEWIKRYGKLETSYTLGKEETKYGQNNTSSKGRQVVRPQEKPGISPLVYSQFLLDKTVFLDLSEMSKFLPDFNEIVETVSISDTQEDENGNVVESEEKEMLIHYRAVIGALKSAGRQGGGEGRGVLGKMLQFSLSYLDKPYGMSPIIAPFSGVTICEPEDFSFLVTNGKLLSKEKRLVELVEKELSENRNCVIYAEYTSQSDARITDRLKEIIQKRCRLEEHEVVIIESSNPSARQREQWMHRKAAQGAKVFITNPRNVETGLDFKWEDGGVTYNYPTLIFYQIGYSLFTVIQASRRAYRLNQDRECRVYYLAVKGTVQEVVIKLIAEKNMATSAISGHFTTSGLNALANGCDAKLELAKALAEKDNYHTDDLQDLFDALHKDDTDLSRYGDYHPMLTFSELMGEDAADKSQDYESPVSAYENMFALFDRFTEKGSAFDNAYPLLYSSEEQSSDAETARPFDVKDYMNELLAEEEKQRKKKERAEKKNRARREKQKELGQFSLF